MFKRLLLVLTAALVMAAMQAFPAWGCTPEMPCTTNTTPTSMPSDSTSNTTPTTGEIDEDLGPDWRADPDDPGGLIWELPEEIDDETYYFFLEEILNSYEMGGPYDESYTGY